MDGTEPIDNRACSILRIPKRAVWDTREQCPATQKRVVSLKSAGMLNTRIDKRTSHAVILAPIRERKTIRGPEMLLSR